MNPDSKNIIDIINSPPFYYKIKDSEHTDDERVNALEDWVKEHRIHNYESMSLDKLEQIWNLLISRKKYFFAYTLTKLKEIVSNLHMVDWNSRNITELITRIELLYEKSKGLCYSSVRHIGDLANTLHIQGSDTETSPEIITTI